MPQQHPEDFTGEAANCLPTEGPRGSADNPPGADATGASLHTCADSTLCQFALLRVHRKKKIASSQASPKVGNVYWGSKVGTNHTCSEPLSFSINKQINK